MAETANPPPEGRRRRMMNRRGMAFSGNTMANSTVTEGVGNEPSDDDDLNEQVRQAATRTPDYAVPSEAESPALQSVANAEDFSPRSRLDQVRTRSSDYEREYRLQLLHRLLMRNLPLDEIASQLGISVRQVQRDRSELTERLRAEARLLDTDVLIGDSSGFYGEVQAMAMRAASNAQIPMPMRLAAMRTALAAHNDKHRFYQAAGVYDVLRFRKGAGEGAQTDIQRLMQITEDLLAESKGPRENALGQFSGGDSEVINL